MGHLAFLYNEYGDPDGSDPPYVAYTPYAFSKVVPQMDRGFHRRDVVATIPAMDSALPAYGRMPSPVADRKFSTMFRVFTSRNSDYAYDLLMAQVAPGYAQRLVWLTDGGTQRFTVGMFLDCEMTGTVQDAFYVDFKVSWRIRPDWRLRHSQGEDLWGNNDGVWGTNDGVWGGGNAVALTTNPTTVPCDNTGDAVLGTMPTLDDWGPLIEIDGAFGGTNGLDSLGRPVAITITNTSMWITDTTGTRVNPSLWLPSPATDALHYVLDCATQQFTYGGALFRPTKPSYQPYFMAIRAGIVNTLVLQGVGTSPTTGGYCLVNWWKKFA